MDADIVEHRVEGGELEVEETFASASKADDHSAHDLGGAHGIRRIYAPVHGIGRGLLAAFRRPTRHMPPFHTRSFGNETLDLLAVVGHLRHRAVRMLGDDVEIFRRATPQNIERPPKVGVAGGRTGDERLFVVFPDRLRRNLDAPDIGLRRDEVVLLRIGIAPHPRTRVRLVQDLIGAYFAQSVRDDIRNAVLPFRGIFHDKISFVAGQHAGVREAVEHVNAVFVEVVDFCDVAIRIDPAVPKPHGTDAEILHQLDETRHVGIGVDVVAEALQDWLARIDHAEVEARFLLRLAIISTDREEPLHRAAESGGQFQFLRNLHRIQFDRQHSPGGLSNYFTLEIKSLRGHLHVCVPRIFRAAPDLQLCRYLLAGIVDRRILVDRSAYAYRLKRIVSILRLKNGAIVNPKRAGRDEIETRHYKTQRGGIEIAVRPFLLLPDTIHHKPVALPLRCQLERLAIRAASE